MLTAEKVSLQGHAAYLLVGVVLLGGLGGLGGVHGDCLDCLGGDRGWISNVGQVFGVDTS
jgi:hypothetical protein